MKKYLLVLAVILAVALPVAGAYAACPMRSGDVQGMHKGGCAMMTDKAGCQMKDGTKADCPNADKECCKGDKGCTDKSCADCNMKSECQMNGMSGHKMGMMPAGHHGDNAVVTQVKKQTGQKRIKSAICPVMKNKIPDVTKAAGKSIYKGKTYYFCCSGCKPMFDSNPAKYAGAKK